MKKLPLRLIATKLNGEIIQGADDLTIRGIAIGTKKIKRDTLHFDKACQRPAAPVAPPDQGTYAVVTDQHGDFAGWLNAAVVRVPDIAQAYWDFIDFYRDMFDIPVIGVTGTCGKTTTKEMIRHILSGYCNVSMTYKSLNALFRNLGYLLEIDDRTQAAVFELGIAFPGDLTTSCRYFKPKVGVITNIGIDHLQGFGTLDAYIRGKSELLEGMGYQGTLIINADDENIRKINLQKFTGPVVTFGFGDLAQFRISGVSHDAECLRFTLRHRGRDYRLAIPGHAEFDAYNASAALAAAHAVGADMEAAVARLASFHNVERHFEFRPGINGSTVIDDTWSTNPTSVQAALKLLSSLARGRKTVAVLGKMSLLGKQSRAYHRFIGEEAAKIGIDRLVLLGDGADEIGRGALRNGMDPAYVIFCRDTGEALPILTQSLDENTIALVKTSMLASYQDMMGKLVVPIPSARLIAEDEKVWRSP